MNQTRRKLLQDALKVLAWSQLPLAPLMLSERAQAADVKRRFLHIFLRGGWDAHLGTDPVIGSKASSVAYNSAYQGLSTFTVSGKSNLIGGWGLEPLRQALSLVPTAFINGLFTEVTAHELAQNYMYSGVLSLSRTREFPSLSALMGVAAGTFPAHVVLGGPVPLGESKLSNPPLQAQSGAGLADMLRGPYNQWVKTSSFEPVHDLIKQLDAIHKTQQSPGAQAAMAGWESAATQLDQLYATGVGQKLSLDAVIKSRYGITDDYSAQTLIPSAFLTLASGLSPYVTLSIDGFDTHSNHFAQHVPIMRLVAAQIAILINDLRSTEDSLQPGSSLMDNTTILISSEFVRTPGLNAGSGTDHWPSASAVLLGKGVQDNTVIGRTDDNAQALGWLNGAPVARTTDTQITPEHLVATLLDHMGFSAAAQTISGGRIVGLFT
ncbi:MAG TPA: DUF1501 domain-containing protein [Oligoflexus sp.]|uniref:DUF1501 domain-containing protein n=1 Tax=Oligoflexus sp. TaxID=1971216 RepID=UPI002D7330BA|nr:DUF1501 domain-containing protein [Oligoflexus sp.]HYX36116.1 DUF1501 domain-containing protein [Oligoflexus sp.]